MMTKKLFAVVLAVFFFILSPKMTPIFAAIQMDSSASKAEEAKATEGKADADKESGASDENSSALSLLKKACDAAIEKYQDSTDSERLVASREKLRQESRDLLYKLNRHPNRTAADGWTAFLNLKELVRTLSSDHPDEKVLELSRDRFFSDADGVRDSIFHGTAVALKDYLEQANPTESIEDRKKAFVDACQLVQDCVAELLKKENADDAETLAVTLKFLRERQPKSEEVRTIYNLVLSSFSKPNIQIEVRDRCLFSDKSLPFSEPITVNEDIRGTINQGEGTASGALSASLVKNDRQAEIRLKLDASISTKTVGYNQGVRVFSSGNGSVTTTKSIYFLDNLQTTPATVSGSMQANITGIDSGRGPVGTNVVYDRVYQEFPYSRAESERRMKLRLAQRFDKQVDQAIGKKNGLTTMMVFLRDHDYFPRLLSSRTTDSRLYWSALVGDEYQLGSARDYPIPDEKYDLLVRVHQSAPNNAFFFSLPGEKISDEDLLKKIKEMFPNLAAKIQKNSSGSFLAASTSAPLSSNPTPVETRVLRVNPETVANDAPATEKGISGGESAEKTPVLETEGTPKVTESAVGAEGDTVDENAAFSILFSEELPLTFVFDDNRVTISAGIVQFEQDGKTFPGLDIEVIYDIGQIEGDIALIQRSLEAWPSDIDRNASLPARYQAIRNQVLKRLSGGLEKEYRIKPIPLYKMKGLKAEDSTVEPEQRGSLVPVEVIAKDGWLVFGANFVPTP